MQNMTFPATLEGFRDVKKKNMGGIFLFEMHILIYDVQEKNQIPMLNQDRQICLG